MITEEQFTTAMERAVEKRGAEWRYPTTTNAPPGFYIAWGECPTYSDYLGNPTCLIGAALHELQVTLPRPDTSPSAMSLLMPMMDAKVALAARCAQVHQDRRNPWGKCLAVYRAALEVQESRIFSPFEQDMAYHYAIRHMGGQSVENSSLALQNLVASFTSVSEASKAVSSAMTTLTVGPITFGNCTASGGMTITGISIVNAAGKVLVDIPEVGPMPKSLLTKGQHALIA